MSRSASAAGRPGNVLRGEEATASARRVRDEELKPALERIWHEHRCVYGADKVWHQLRRQGLHVARCTVERLMRELGIRGVVRGKRMRTTFPADVSARPADLVERLFHMSRPNQLWVADIT